MRLFIIPHCVTDASFGHLSRAVAPSAVLETSSAPPGWQCRMPCLWERRGPHSGCLPQDEKERIEALGGFVSYMDCWRVNGTLAVSRAIGKEARGERKAAQG